MNTTRKIVEAIVITCGPLAFVVLETAPRVKYFGLGG